METSPAQEITDRRGVSLSDPPSPEDIEQHANELRIIADDELPHDSLSRVAMDELEQRRLQAITR